MSALLRVRAMDDLPRACREASELLAIQYRRRSRSAGVPPVLGIWVDARPAQALSVALSRPERADARRMFPVRESAGVPEVWTIFWLDVPDGTGTDAARRLIVQTLIEGAGRGRAGDTLGRFVPVFAADATLPAWQREMRCLRERFPGRLGSPLFQDPVTGRLSPPQDEGADG